MNNDKKALRFARRDFFIKNMLPIDKMGFKYITFIEINQPKKTDKGFEFDISTFPHEREYEMDNFRLKYIKEECISYTFNLTEPAVREYFELNTMNK